MSIAVISPDIRKVDLEKYISNVKNGFCQNFSSGTKFNKVRGCLENEGYKITNREKI